MKRSGSAVWKGGLQDGVGIVSTESGVLSATPYNKTYQDLSSQLRLFVAEDKDLGVRPERLLRELGDAAFAALGQVAPRTIAAVTKNDVDRVARTYLRSDRRTVGWFKPLSEEPPSPASPKPEGEGGE